MNHNAKIHCFIQIPAWHKRQIVVLIATGVIPYICIMKKVSILVPESSVMQAIADPQYLFTAVNQFLAVQGRPQLFDVELVGAKKQVKLNDGLYTVNTTRQIKDVVHTDLVLIPALFGDMQTAVKKNKALEPWIVEQYEGGAEVASLCVGAFLLASTGLLNGKKMFYPLGLCQ